MSFALDISRFVAKANGRMDLVVREVALDLHRGVVTKTPVDTGRARGNWNVGVNNVDPSVSEAAKSRGAAVTALAEQIIQQAKAGDVVWITNNVDYINELEHGSSKQAPHGMVRVTIRNYPGIVERSVNGAKRQRP